MVVSRRETGAEVDGTSGASGPAAGGLVQHQSEHERERGRESGVGAAPGVGASDAAGDQLWDAVSRVVHARRSNLRVDPERAVPQQLIDRLLDLACWAPNHKHTQPWRFAVVTGQGRARLGEAAATGLPRLGVTAPARSRRRV
jgi:hypothetical protein